MLPAFVIGLREGLEAVVILGAIAVFIAHEHRRDLLRRLWRAVLAATALCLVVAIVIRVVEVNLPWRQQEQLETVVGAAAVAMVTYMIVWMRRFPKDLMRDSGSSAASALARGSGGALIAMAFFAVLREGFEISVFVLATFSASGSNAVLSTTGAVLGVLVSVAVGVALVRGGLRLNVARFFRATALVLVLTAAGLAMTAMHTANASGWLNVGQTPQFDLSWLAPPGSILSSIVTGMFGIQPYPVVIEVVTWFAYLVPMTLVVIWPRRRALQRAVASPTIAAPPERQPVS